MLCGGKPDAWWYGVWCGACTKRFLLLLDAVLLYYYYDKWMILFFIMSGYSVLGTCIFVVIYALKYINVNDR